MTRKEAISRAIAIVSSYPKYRDEDDLLEKLMDIEEDINHKHWNQKNILDRIDQFIVDNNRLPKCSDLATPTMPNRKIIQLHFNMKFEEFCYKYYRDKMISRSYIQYDKQYWIDNFKRQYNTLKPRSSNMYNECREKNTPSTRYMKKICEVKTWLELLQKLGLEPYSQVSRSKLNLPRIKQYQMSVDHTSNLERDIEEFLINKKF